MSGVKTRMISRGRPGLGGGGKNIAEAAPEIARRAALIQVAVKP